MNQVFVLRVYLEGHPEFSETARYLDFISTNGKFYQSKHLTKVCLAFSEVRIITG